MLPPAESQQPPPPPPPPAERAVDLLRDLPPELLDKILAGLPARDVVRTSVLSQPWERRWESTAGLISSSTVSDDTGARGSVANNFINRFLAGVPVHDDNSGAWWGSAARFLENCAGPVGRVSIRGVPLSVYNRAELELRCCSIALISSASCCAGTSFFVCLYICGMY